MRKVTVVELNDVMQFDHVVQVHDDSMISDDLAAYAPELHDGRVSEGWSLLNGYSGQYSYAGPVMHASEFIGGVMARDILSEPGIYVAVVNYASDGGEPDGWAVAKRND